MNDYIKKSEAVDVIEKYPYNIAGKTATAIKMIEDLPSADVVPKSEVEKWKNAAKIANKEREKLSNHYFIDTTIGNGTPLQRAKRELAREIFEEIDDIFLMFKPQYFVDAPHLNYKRLTDLFAELKKKYTEETK